MFFYTMSQADRYSAGSYIAVGELGRWINEKYNFINFLYIVNYEQIF